LGGHGDRRELPLLTSPLAVRHPVMSGRLYSPNRLLGADLTGGVHGVALGALGPR
jgi:hypothetical protein